MAAPFIRTATEPAHPAPPRGHRTPSREDITTTEQNSKFLQDCIVHDDTSGSELASDTFYGLYVS